MGSIEKLTDKSEEYFDKLEGFKSSYLSEYEKESLKEFRERKEKRKEKLSNISSIESLFTRIATRGSDYIDKEKVKEILDEMCQYIFKDLEYDLYVSYSSGRFVVKIGDSNLNITKEGIQVYTNRYCMPLKTKRDLNNYRGIDALRMFKCIKEYNKKPNIKNFLKLARSNFNKENLNLIDYIKTFINTLDGSFEKVESLIEEEIEHNKITEKEQRIYIINTVYFIKSFDLKLVRTLSLFNKFVDVGFQQIDINEKLEFEKGYMDFETFQHIYNMKGDDINKKLDLDGTIFKF